MKHQFVINGVGAAFLRIFGCECGRCRADDPQVNCSASLISTDAQGMTAHHVLFDIGGGVVDQLTRSPFLRGAQARLDWLVLTHWHPDHAKDINRLLASHIQTAHLIGYETPGKIPLWCRSGTAAWMRRLYEYEIKRYCNLHHSKEFLPPGHLLSALPIDLPGLQITPVTLSHQNADIDPFDYREKRPCSAGFILESPKTKIVIFWDVDNKNDWIERPSNREQEKTVTRLSGADHIFFDCTFWKKRDKPKNHASFDDVRRWARALAPRNTWLVHITGHVEGIGNEGFGWTNPEWQENARRVWREEGLPGAVGVPVVGQCFGFE